MTRFAILDIRQRIQRRRRKLAALALLRLRDMTRVRNFLTTEALIDPSYAPWHTLYRSRHAGSFISIVSIDSDSFDYLLEHFGKHYIVLSGPGKRGRPSRILQKHAVLGCLLHFYTAEIRPKSLCKMFGVPPSTLSRIMGNAETALSLALKEIPEARIRWPSFEDQRLWAGLCEEKEPLVKGCFGVADGLNLPVQEPTDSDLQNAMYNGIISHLNGIITHFNNENV